MLKFEKITSLFYVINRLFYKNIHLLIYHIQDTRHSTRYTYSSTAATSQRHARSPVNSVVRKRYTPYTPYTLRKFQDNLGCT